MSKAATAQTAADIFEPALALDVIELSPTNPRKHITEAEIDEMAATIREHGVIQPILVRPRPFKKDGYELVAGERRFKGSKRAEMTTIPALIRELGDIQVLEIQLAENVGRRDLHEMDEARSYQTMIDSGQYDVKSLAHKLGASKETIYKRLKLTGACEEVRQLFYDKEKTGVTANHVEQIARLPEVSQRVVIEKGLFKKRPAEDQTEPQGLTLAEVLTDGPAEARAKSFRAGNITYDAQYLQVVSTRELDAFIHSHIYSLLSAAIFATENASLFPEAGACSACPKRFGQVCADRACFHKKTNAAIDAKVTSGEWIAATSDWHKKDAHYFVELQAVERNSCAHAQKVVCVDGGIRGETKFACLFLKCEIHHPAPKQATLPALGESAQDSGKPANQKDRELGQSSQKSDPPRSIKGEYQEAKREADEAQRSEILEALDELRRFADRAMEHIEHDSMFLARGSADAALERAQRIRYLLEAAVEDQFSADKKVSPPQTAGDHKRAKRLDKALKKRDGALAKSDFVLEVRGVPIRIEMERSFPGFKAHAVDWKKPFISETGFRSFVSDKPWPGEHRDVFVRRVIEAHIDAPRKPKRAGAPQGLGGELVAIDAHRFGIPPAKKTSRRVITGRPGKSVKRPTRETLFTCPRCHRINFTKRGLAAHVCKAKVSARTKTGKRRR